MRSLHAISITGLQRRLQATQGSARPQCARNASDRENERAAESDAEARGTHEEFSRPRAA